MVHPPINIWGREGLGCPQAPRGGEIFAGMSKIGGVPILMGGTAPRKGGSIDDSSNTYTRAPHRKKPSDHQVFLLLQGAWVEKVQNLAKIMRIQKSQFLIIKNPGNGV